MAMARMLYTLYDIITVVVWISCYARKILVQSINIYIPTVTPSD